MRLFAFLAVAALLALAHGQAHSGTEPTTTVVLETTTPTPVHHTPNIADLETTQPPVVTDPTVHHTPNIADLETTQPSVAPTTTLPPPASVSHSPSGQPHSPSGHPHTTEPTTTVVLETTTAATVHHTPNIADLETTQPPVVTDPTVHHTPNIADLETTQPTVAPVTTTVAQTTAHYTPNPADLHQSTEASQATTAATVHHTPNAADLHQSTEANNGGSVHHTPNAADLHQSTQPTSAVTLPADDPDNIPGDYIPVAYNGGIVWVSTYQLVNRLSHKIYSVADFTTQAPAHDTLASSAGSLSAAAGAGIALGVVAGVALLVFAAIKLRGSSRRSRRVRDSSASVLPISRSPRSSTSSYSSTSQLIRVKSWTDTVEV